MALTNYLVYLPSHNGFIMDIDVEEELNDRLNGGYPDDDYDGARDFENTMREVELERSCVLLVDYRIEQSSEGGGELCAASCWGNYKPR